MNINIASGYYNPGGEGADDAYAIVGRNISSNITIGANLYVGGCIMYNTSGTAVTLGTCI